jgi:hypothetical protein
VLVARDRVSQYERGVETSSIPKNAIRSAEFTYGPASTNPAALLVLGLGVIVIGLAPLVLIPMWAAAHGGGFPAVAVAWFAIIIPGAWIVREAIRKRLFLRVTTAEKTAIFVLDSEADVETTRTFVQHAKTELGFIATLDEIALGRCEAHQPAAPN